MSIIDIEYGSLISSATLNNNFQYLEESIQNVATQLTAVNAALAASISSLSTTLSSQVSELADTVDSLSETLDSTNSEVSGLVGTTSYSKSANGYYKLSNGLIIQWGSFSSVSYKNTQTVSFPTSFTTSAPRVMLSSNYTQTHGDKASSCSVTLTSASSFTYRSGFEQSSPTVYYIAIGY